MAKNKPKVTPSMLDFNEENLLEDLSNTPDGEEEENQEEELEEPPVIEKKKPIVKAKPTPPPAEEEEEEEEPIEEKEEPNKTGNQNEATEEEEEEPTGQQFWEEVAKITGNEVDVDYGEIDPISPQGAALREQAVAERAVETFLSRLEDEYPAVYQALSYAHAGGDVRELYQAEKDYTKIQIADGDEEHAKAFLIEYYQKKGFNESRAKRMVSADVESEEGVVGTAKAALAETVQEQQQEQQEKILAQQAAAKQQREQDTKFLNGITSLLNQGQIGTFKIPSKEEAGQFMQHVRSLLQRDGEGGYMMVQRVDPAQLEQLLQAEYFRFKKGDLSKLIQVKATTQTTQGLKLRLERDKKAIKSTASSSPSGSSLKDYDVT
jgi:hypothetical protein